MEITNQNTNIQRLESKNRELQSKNKDFVRQNQELRNENKGLQNQLDNANGSASHQSDKLPNRPNNNQQTTVSPQTENIVSEPPEKIQDYKGVITRAGSHSNQGFFDFGSNDYDEAIRQFKQAIMADSKLAIAHYNLGCAYLEMKEYQSAVDAFDGAIAVDQKFKESYYNRSIAYLRMSKFPEAKLDATKALDIDSNYQLAQGLLTAIENAQR